jgi:competence protein CoiA
LRNEKVFGGEKMLWAIKDSQRIQAEPGKSANCEICNQELIPKCGSIKVWHWSHKVSSDCDSWSEEETQWHKDWKDEFPRECQEIIIEEHWNNKHRADVKYNNLIIEFQNSSISPEDILIREAFYKNMIWVLNGKTFSKGINLRERIAGLLKPMPIKRIYENQRVTFRWKSPPKSWWSAKKPIYIHLNGKAGESYFGGQWMLKINNVYHDIPCGGWGIILSKEEFLKRIKEDGTSKKEP